jgi:hypothetical protein
LLAAAVTLFLPALSNDLDLLLFFRDGLAAGRGVSAKANHGKMP